MSSPEERKAEKRARRKFRAEIEHRMLRVATKRCGLFATTAQLYAMARQLTDRYMHSVDHAPTHVKPIEDVDVPNLPNSCPT